MTNPTSFMHHASNATLHSLESLSEDEYGNGSASRIMIDVTESPSLDDSFIDYRSASRDFSSSPRFHPRRSPARPDRSQFYVIDDDDDNDNDDNSNSNIHRNDDDDDDDPSQPCHSPTMMAVPPRPSTSMQRHAHASVIDLTISPEIERTRRRRDRPRDIVALASSPNASSLLMPAHEPPLSTPRHLMRWQPRENAPITPSSLFVSPFSASGSASASASASTSAPTSSRLLPNTISSSNNSTISNSGRSSNTNNSNRSNNSSSSSSSRGRGTSHRSLGTLSRRVRGPFLHRPLPPAYLAYLIQGNESRSSRRPMRLTSSGLLAEQSREDWRELERQQESEFDLPFSFLPPSTEPLTPFDQLRRHFPTLFQESSGSHIGGHRRTFRQREMDVAQLLLGPTEDQLSYESLWELAEYLGYVKSRAADPAKVAQIPTFIFPPSHFTAEASSRSHSSNCLESDEQCCCICLADYEAGDSCKRLVCHHAFHASCLDQWLAHNGTCPVCRAPFTG